VGSAGGFPVTEMLCPEFSSTGWSSPAPCPTFSSGILAEAARLVGPGGRPCALIALGPACVRLLRQARSVRPPPHPAPDRHCRRRSQALRPWRGGDPPAHPREPAS